MSGKKEKQMKGDITEITYEFREKPVPKKWHKFIYDSSEGTFFDRTAKSWAQLGLFYLIFYIVLASLFAICMQALLSTLTHEHPKWQLDASRIGTNPGLGFRPIGDENDGGRISVNVSDPATVQRWTQLLDEFLEPYHNRSLLAGGGANQIICNPGANPPPGKVCLFDDTKFGTCSKNNEYGYLNQSPCIFLKLNRIFNWVPDFYNDEKDLPENMPEDLKQYIAGQSNKNQVWVSCNAQFGEQKELFDNFTYPAGRGFSGEFYPYTNAPGYLSPLVPVQVTHVKFGLPLSVECRAWAKNIIYRGGRERTGSVTYTISFDEGTRI